MDWNDDLAALADDEEPSLVDMETVNEEADTSADAQQEAHEVAQRERSRFPLKEGDNQYLVSKTWFRDWEAYAGYPPGGQQLIRAEHSSHARPGTIDNSDILDSSAVDKLKPHLQEGKEFKLLSEEAWTYLHGLYSGGPVISRRVVMQKGQAVVEIYPVVLRIRRSSDPGSAVSISVSVEATFADLKEKACKVYNLEEVDVKMWDYWGGNYYDGPNGLLDDSPDEKLAQGTLTENQEIMLLEKDEDGNFPEVKPRGASTVGPSQATPIQLGRPTTNVNTTSNYSFGRNSYSTDTTYQVEGRKRGLAGLSNLGNTCFMNSSVQCLAHAAPLVRVFLTGAYKRDLNPDNPLGNKGELAEAFGSLMKLLWQGGVGSVSPKGFKAALARFAPQFGGYSQQDSQELLAFLLDGLHEDLNRVRQKPYVEEADAEGRPDKVVAAEAWDNYRKRNDSVVVDHFQGLYKSTLVCPQCSFSSVKFDPFMYLSLPLPSSKTRTLYITLIYVDGSQLPIIHAIDVPKTATVGAVYEALAQHAGVAGSADPMEVLLLALLAGNRITRTYTDSGQPMPEKRDSAQLLAYRYASPAEGPKSGHSEVHFLHRRRLRKRAGFGGSEASSVFAAPLVLFLPEDDIQALREQTVKENLEWNQKEYTVERPNNVERLLEDALRPFKRPKVEDASHPASDAENAPSASGRDMSTAIDDMFARASSLPNGSTTPTPGAPADVFGSASPLPAFGGPSPSSAMDIDKELQDMSGPLQSPHESFELLENPKGDDMSPERVDAAAEFNQPFSDEESVPIEVEAPEGASGDGEVSSQQRIEVAAEQQQSSALQWGEASATPANAVDDGWVGDDDTWGNVSGTWPGMGPDPDPNSIPDSPPPLGNECLESSPAPNVTPQATPNASPIVSPDNSPRGIPTAQPFNMWQQSQSEENDDATAEPIALANGDVKAQWPWRLKWADSNGGTRLYVEPSTTAQQLHFAVEWAAEGAAEYDVAALESPRLSDSARAAQEREQATTSTSFSLHQCVEAFLQPEQLDAADSWYCGRCKEHVRAEKKLDLWSLPELLVVHLKRFSYSRHSRDKLDAPVHFPLSALDLSSFLLREQDVAPVYDLYAVSNHFGGLGGGHYTAYCRMDDDGWHCFDDSHVSPADESSVQSKAAYLLFYRRRHEAQLEPGTLPEELPDGDMANAAAATCNSEQPAEASQRAEPKQHALPNGNALAEPASTAGAADDDVAGEGTRENGGLPTTQLEDSFVFLSDGGSSKEEDLYGDTSPDAGATAALQTSPGGGQGAQFFESAAFKEEELSCNGFTSARKLF